jgi:hypothetical protein
MFMFQFLAILLSDRARTTPAILDGLHSVILRLTIALKLWRHHEERPGQRESSDPRRRPHSTNTRPAILAVISDARSLLRPEYYRQIPK